jgi:hypothetical protein
MRLLTLISLCFLLACADQSPIAPQPTDPLDGRQFITTDELGRGDWHVYMEYRRSFHAADHSDA